MTNRWPEGLTRSTLLCTDPGLDAALTVTSRVAEAPALVALAGGAEALEPFFSGTIRALRRGSAHDKTASLRMRSETAFNVTVRVTGLPTGIAPKNTALGEAAISPRTSPTTWAVALD